MTAPHAAEVEIKPETHIFKRVGELAIKADVYRSGGSGKQPVVVWIHGGGLIMGGRQGIQRRLLRNLIEGGYAVVSIDYRLAPQTKLPEIVQDVEDALAWVYGDGGRMLGFNVEKVAVMGASAGGYLTLVAGQRVKPRPKVLVSFWGYGELIGPWYSEPSPHARHHRSKMSEEQAAAFVASRPVANDAERATGGSAFYSYCRQKGVWPKLVAGWDPRAEADRFTPYMPLRNVSHDFPPTLLIHGMEDTDVPYEQSEMMAREFSKHQVPHQLLGIPKAEHGLAGVDQRTVSETEAAALAFLKKYLAE